MARGSKKDPPDQGSVNFSVDAALLSELGERLVGKPHIALAELVKNSYDADGHKAEIELSPNKIVVADDGHGMDFDAFQHFWMRVGSPHKQTQRVSPRLKRPLTGSKGVGRLSVQFLARKVEIVTVARKRGAKQIRATVDWDRAVRAGDLQKARARYRIEAPSYKFPNGQKHGTAIILTQLNHEWDRENVEALATEIWPLQPPFRANPNLEQREAFEVVLQSPLSDAEEAFVGRMRALLDIWEARLIGKLERLDSEGRVKLSLVFADGTRHQASYVVERCAIDHVEFEIRVYDLRYRQKHGIKVAEAREYLNSFGGVHVYDAGFHLPYYGVAHDWLNIEIAHSHRRQRSELLPDRLQVPRGLTHLPTQSRLYGVVHVDTSKERDAKMESGQQECLQIQVSRDRLVDNLAFQNLKYIVRWALDFYSMKRAQRVVEKTRSEKPIKPASQAIKAIEEVLEEFADEIPTAATKEIRRSVETASRVAHAESKSLSAHVGLLGALATAGMTALATEHEMAREYSTLRALAKEAEERSPEDVAQDLKEWIDRVISIRQVISYLTNEEDRERRARPRAAAFLSDVWSRLGPLRRDVALDVEQMDEALRLPLGTAAEWAALFQNVFVNAINAMLDKSERMICVWSHRSGKGTMLYVEDTGVGVDLDDAERLFEPFERRLEISQERRQLGVGGSGLGLTIVKMIAENLGCTVGFEEPSEGFSTAFWIWWREVE